MEPSLPNVLLTGVTSVIGAGWEFVQKWNEQNPSARGYRHLPESCDFL